MMTTFIITDFDVFRICFKLIYRFVFCVFGYCYLSDLHELEPKKKVTLENDSPYSLYLMT